MKPAFISGITNVQRFMGAFSALLERGASESCIMLVDGEPGLGKTQTARWWSAQRGAWRVRAQEKWTQSWLLADLYRAMTGRDAPHRDGKSLFRAVIETIGHHQASMASRGQQPVIVIDEVDHAIRAGKVVTETLRGITDLTEIPTVLVGMDELGALFAKKNPQLWSRISQRVTFDKLSLDDTRKIIAGIAEVTLADDLTAFLHGACKGYTRELYAALARVERAARRIEGPVTCPHLSGQVVLYDRDAARAVVVP